MIVTANPNAEKTWESFHFDYQKEGKKIIGKIHVPINPMSKSITYQHSQDEILNALKRNGLEVLDTDEYGLVNEENIFFSIKGKKNYKYLDLMKNNELLKIMKNFCSFFDEIIIKKYISLKFLLASKNFF